MLDFTLIRNILIIALSSSIISTSLIQRLKEGTRSKKYILFKSFIISMIVGICFSLSFSNIEVINSLWVGLISFIGADAIYKSFEDKIFASFSSIENVIYIERGAKNWL